MKQDPLGLTLISPSNGTWAACDNESMHSYFEKGPFIHENQPSHVAMKTI